MAQLTREECARRIVEAVEAFVDAKILYDKSDSYWRNSHDVDETREHLRDKLGELLARIP